VAFAASRAARQTPWLIQDTVDAGEKAVSAARDAVLVDLAPTAAAEMLKERSAVASPMRASPLLKRLAGEQLEDEVQRVPDPWTQARLAAAKPASVAVEESVLNRYLAEQVRKARAADQGPTRS
jgi:hypothetical protein